MTVGDQITALEQQGDAASRQGQERQAAFFYEQARRLAADHGQKARAFSTGVKAVRTWFYGGDQRRALTVLLDILHDPPPDADPWDVYDAKEQYWWYLLYSKTAELDDLTSRASELDSTCAALGEPDNRDICERTQYLLQYQGKWYEALTQCEIGWARTAGGGVDRGSFASGAARCALRLGRRSDAERWLPHIASDDWPQTMMARQAYMRLRIALYDNDIAAARKGLRNLDNAVLGIERAGYDAAVTELAVAALAQDERFGDPLAALHPATLRLAEFPRSELEIPDSAYKRHCANIFRYIAGVRYAARISPVDDVYYRRPHQLSGQRSSRSPKELPQRASAARQACDDAKPTAIHLDKAFRCCWRQQEIQGLRERVGEVGLIHGL